VKYAFNAEIGADHSLKGFPKNTFKRALMTFQPGQLVTITLSKARKDRTDNQNNYYWGVPIKMIADTLGYEKDEVHDALKAKFLAREGVLPRIPSTTTLTTVEFNEYLERIGQWAAEFLGIVIPDPNEVDY